MGNAIDSSELEKREEEVRRREEAVEKEEKELQEIKEITTLRKRMEDWKERSMA